MGSKVAVKKPRFYAGIMKCDNCGNLPTYINHRKQKVQMKGMRQVHINIQNDPTHHYFCGNDCKLKWIYNGGKSKK
jgi:hypothetical protein